MAGYERPNVPQGGTINLRATPVASAIAITQVQIYQGGTAGQAGTGTLVATIPGASVTIVEGEYVAQWTPPPSQATGVYYDDWTYQWSGVTQPVSRLAGFNVTPAAVLSSGAAVPYPYPYGYCQLTDVQAQIPNAIWNPSDASYSPTSANVQGWITQEASKIDSALGRRGYMLPLTPAAGFTAIGPQVWALLLDINAALVGARVLAAIHGAQDITEDPEAMRLFHYADDYLARLERGDDNLAIFGVAGTWNPDPNPANAVSVGGLYDPDTDTGLTKPFFTRGMKF